MTPRIKSIHKAEGKYIIVKEISKVAFPKLYDTVKEATDGVDSMEDHFETDYNVYTLVKT